MKFAKELIEIGNNLPFGAMKKIAEETGFSPTYITFFFQGSVEVTQNNKKILVAAKKLIKSEQAKITRLDENIIKNFKEIKD